MFSCCDCEPTALTMVRARLWPASPRLPKLAFTFELLEWAEALLLECQVALGDFCKALHFKSPHLTNKVNSKHTLSLEDLHNHVCFLVMVVFFLHFIFISRREEASWFLWMLYLDFHGKSLPDRVIEIHFMATYSSKINLQLMSMLLVLLEEMLMIRFYLKCFVVCWPASLLQSGVQWLLSWWCATIIKSLQSPWWDSFVWLCL